jgi:hypothetical protein
LIRYDGLAESTDANQYIIGKSISTARVFAYAGVNSETGLYQFRDAKGAITSNPSDQDDRTVLIDLNPKWYGGFSSSFSYKGFDLDVFFQFVKQTAASNRFGAFPGINPNENQPTSVLNRWHKPGDQAEIQKVTTNFGEVRVSGIAAGNSDGAYSDAAYARLKNASLSYTFNNNMIRKAHISSARVYVQGQNLLTITKYFGGGDPETLGLGTLAPLRIFTVGTQLTF